MSKHTPGPWCISRHASTYVVSANERGICSTGGYQTTLIPPEQLNAENEANAHLIAKAPELLAALREIMAEVDSNSLSLDVFPGGDGRLLRARALLAEIDGDADSQG